jgi:putative FmdB family regulatory protein
VPIYEYACTCGKTFEELVVRKGDEQDVRCPGCGGAQVARLMSRPAATATGKAGASAGPRQCGPVG